MYLYEISKDNAPSDMKLSGIMKKTVSIKGIRKVSNGFIKKIEKN